MLDDLNWVKVSSSMINSIAYGEYGNLYVRFNNGDTYVYDDVTYDIFEEFLKSSSPGKYFHSNVKNNYRFEKCK